MTSPAELKIDRPVTGEITQSYRNSTRQYSPAEFLAEIDAALAVEGVKGLVWEQYTPYFNDGEPCEFSVHEARVLLEGDDDDDDDDDDDSYNREYETGWSPYDIYNYRDGEYPNGHNSDRVAWKTLPGGVSGRTVYELLHSLNSDAWETVALANFGDHAIVTATREGFRVEYYDHD